MVIEQSGSGVVPTDRSATLLAELQTVCQRILANEGRLPGEPGHLAPTLIATANGTALAGSLEALRRQCVDNNQQIAALKRSVDALRGVVAGDSADNGKMLVELRRSVDTIAEIVAGDTTQSGEVVRSVEALRVGLAGFSASNRQQVSELRGSLNGFEQTLTALGDHVEASVAALGDKVDSAVGSVGPQVETAVATLGTKLDGAVGTLGKKVDGAAEAVDALGGKVDGAVAALGEKVDGALGAMGEKVDGATTTIGDKVDAAVNTLGGQVQGALMAMGEQITAAFGTMASQMQEAFNGFGHQIGEQMGRQTAAFDVMIEELLPQQTRERLDELEKLLTVGLPRFSEEIQAGVQQTLLAVSHTFRLAEREHGNRMSELHRDFDATARRLESAMQPRRREGSVT